MELDSKVLVLGHRGLVGSAIVRRLETAGHTNILKWARDEINLLNPTAVEWAFSVYQPEYVFLAAAKVGGIRSHINAHADMLVENTNIQQNVMLNAAKYGVKKLVFLGSSCIYPEHAPIPTTEAELLNGTLQPANEGYALAKIAGIKLGQYLRREKGFNVVSAMPCNIYGDRDCANVDSAHVIPGMLVRMHLAKLRGEDPFRVWGTAETAREFLHSWDLADALILLMRSYESDEPINVGSGFTLDMKTLAEIIAWTVKYPGEIVFSGQDKGTSVKCMDNSKIRALGWEPRVDFADGLEWTYQSYLNGEFRS